MPRRELKDPRQVEDWLVEISQQLTQPAEMILIGSGGLLWHAFQRGIAQPLPENSMASIQSLTQMKSRVYVTRQYRQRIRGKTRLACQPDAGFRVEGVSR
jgi:hypothetical protein